MKKVETPPPGDSQPVKSNDGSDGSRLDWIPMGGGGVDGNGNLGREFRDPQIAAREAATRARKEAEESFIATARTIQNDGEPRTAPHGATRSQTMDMRQQMQERDNARAAEDLTKELRLAREAKEQRKVERKKCASSPRKRKIPKDLKKTLAIYIEVKEARGEVPTIKALAAKLDGVSPSNLSKAIAKNPGARKVWADWNEAVCERRAELKKNFGKTPRPRT